GRRQPGLRSQGGLGNTHDLTAQLSRLTTLSNLSRVNLLGLREVNKVSRQQVGGTSIDDSTATQHLADDDLDVLVVDGH
nr:hypothetical protein [Escherichia coli]